MVEEWNGRDSPPPFADSWFRPGSGYRAYIRLLVRRALAQLKI